jgi:hypothetical protein
MESLREKYYNSQNNLCRGTGDVCTHSKGACGTCRTAHEYERLERLYDSDHASLSNLVEQRLAQIL